MPDVGSIVFGPLVSPEERKHWAEIESALSGTSGKSFRDNDALGTHVCHCIGPQPGEKLCPCRLRAQSAMGAQMVREGVTINGVHYDLVPSRKA